MNLQQLRYLCAIVDHGLNVSDAAEALHHLAAGHQQAGAAARGRARRQGVRAPGQAPRVAHPRRRIRRRDRAARAARNRQSEARRRRIPERGHRHAGDRHDAHAGALCAAAGAARFRRAAIPRSSSSCIRATRSRSPSRPRAATPTSASPPRRWRRFPELVTLPCYQWNRCVLVPTRPSARRDPAADARGARAVSDRHLRLHVHRPLADQRRVRRRGTRAQRRADRARLRRDQDLRRARDGRRHHCADGLRSRARHGTFEKLDAAHLFAPSTTRLALAPRRRSCAATSTTSSRCSRRRSTAPRSTPRLRGAGGR